MLSVTLVQFVLSRTQLDSSEPNTNLMTHYYTHTHTHTHTHPVNTAHACPSPQHVSHLRLHPHKPLLAVNVLLFIQKYRFPRAHKRVLGLLKGLWDMSIYCDVPARGGAEREM